MRANARAGTMAAVRVAPALALLALLVISAVGAHTDPSAEVRQAPGGSSLCQIYKLACPSFRTPRHTKQLFVGTLHFA